MTKIHASAIIDPKAELGTDVEVGPCGSAMALKIGNNLVSWVHIVLALQAERPGNGRGDGLFGRVRIKAQPPFGKALRIQAAERE